MTFVNEFIVSYDSIHGGHKVYITYWGESILFLLALGLFWHYVWLCRKAFGKKAKSE